MFRCDHLGCCFSQKQNVPCESIPHACLHVHYIRQEYTKQHQTTVYLLHQTSVVRTIVSRSTNRAAIHLQQLLRKKQWANITISNQYSTSTIWATHHLQRSDTCLWKSLQCFSASCLSCIEIFCNAMLARLYNNRNTFHSFIEQMKTVQVISRQK